MFTGIITHTGKLEKKSPTELSFAAPSSLLKRLTEKESIAVSGVCLTVKAKTATTFSVDIMPETLARTAFSRLETNATVNLELPVTPSSFLSGHIVQGHVDGVGKITDIKMRGNSKIVRIEIPKNLETCIVEKGSVAVNGISLTVISLGENTFTVGIIPYTFENTTFRQAAVGDLVNIETDILAKYMVKIFRKSSK